MKQSELLCTITLVVSGYYMPYACSYQQLSWIITVCILFWHSMLWLYSRIVSLESWRIVLASCLLCCLLSVLTLFTWRCLFQFIVTDAGFICLVSPVPRQLECRLNLFPGCSVWHKKPQNQALVSFALASPYVSSFLAFLFRFCCCFGYV